MSRQTSFVNRHAPLSGLQSVALAAATGIIALGLVTGGCPTTTSDQALTDAQLQQVQTVVQDQATSSAEATQIAESVLQSGLAQPRTVDWSSITNVPADQDTNYTAGAGLALNGTTFSVAPSGVVAGMLAPGAVTTAALGAGAVTADKLAPGLVPGQPSGEVADGSITTAKLADGAVTTQKIIDGAITIAKLAGEVFTNFAANLPDGSIDGAKLIDGSVTGTKLASGTVTSNQIEDGTITHADLADDCVTSAKILDGEINTEDLADGAVTSAKIADGTISDVDVAANTLTGDKLATNTITSRELADVIEMGSAAPPVEGRMKVRNSDGFIVVDVSAHVGPTGKGGGILLWDNINNPAGYFVADLGNHSGEFGVARSDGLSTVRLYGDLGSGGVVGAVQVNDGVLERALLGAAPDGFLKLQNSSNATTIQLKGATGDICITGSINPGGGCDLAETFDHSRPGTAEPGMVMVIDATSAGRLTLSTQAYDRKVAGIISGAGGMQPGVKLGQNSANGEHPLALAGRVYCYVDATNQAVEIGDLLTTSDTPGHAMKATDRERAFGAVLGKAMEPLAQGEKGLILVLVALQ